MAVLTIGSVRTAILLMHLEVLPGEEQVTELADDATALRLMHIQVGPRHVKITVSALGSLGAGQLLMDREVRPRKVELAVWALHKVATDGFMLVQDLNGDLL